MQAEAKPPSIAQVVVYGATPPVTPNVTFTLVLLSSAPLIGALIDTTGRAVLIVQVKLAGVASVLPAASVAATVNVWLPPARPEYVFGLVQAKAAPPSIVQANVLGVSVELNEKLALVLLVGLVGLAVIVVSGAIESTVKLTVEEPTLLTASVALTITVCAP